MSLIPISYFCENQILDNLFNAFRIESNHTAQSIQEDSEIKIDIEKTPLVVKINNVKMSDEKSQMIRS